MADAPTILITGASSGLGRSLSLHFAACGWAVWAGVRELAAAPVAPEPTPGRIHPLVLEVTEASSIQAARATLATALGERGLQVLVPNAGLAVAGPVEGVSLEDWRRQWEVNVLGVIAVTQALLPLVRRGRGRLILMSSASGLVSYPLLGPYAASKHALEAVADALRVELSAEQLPVTVIEPGEVRTAIWERSLADFRRREAAWPPELRQRYAAACAWMVGEAERARTHAPDGAAVVRAVHRAATLPRPPTRIRVGPGARFAWLLSHLPDRWRDWLIRRAMTRGN